MELDTHKEHKNITSRVQVALIGQESKMLIEKLGALAINENAPNHQQNLVPFYGFRFQTSPSVIHCFWHLSINECHEVLNHSYLQRCQYVVISYNTEEGLPLNIMKKIPNAVIMLLIPFDHSMSIESKEIGRPYRIVGDIIDLISALSPDIYDFGGCVDSSDNDSESEFFYPSESFYPHCGTICGFM